jgi:hypothetical protein
MKKVCSNALAYSTKLQKKVFYFGPIVPDCSVIFCPMKTSEQNFGAKPFCQYDILPT